MAAQFEVKQFLQVLFSLIVFKWLFHFLGGSECFWTVELESVYGRNIPEFSAETISLIILTVMIWLCITLYKYSIHLDSFMLSRPPSFHVQFI